MARIGIAGLLHETNTFAQSRADLAEFIAADAWPGLSRGQAVIDATRGINIPTAGFVESLSAPSNTAHFELVPLLWASANPSGVVTEHAYETIWNWFADELARAGKLDALFLDLHGSLVTEHLLDGEGEWLRRVRTIVGEHMPIVATLDFHANISADMVRLADALLVYRSYPHVDMAVTGARAAALLPQLLAGKRWHKAFRQLPFLIPLPWQCTLTEPMRSLIKTVTKDEAGIVTCEWAAGFPLADVPDSGPSIIVFSSDAHAAEKHADRLFAVAMQCRPQFVGELLSLEQAVAAMHDYRGQGPLVVAETQDNPGGGGDGDGVAIVHAMIKQGIDQACMGLIFDPDIASQAHRVGKGATLIGELGAKRNRASGPALRGEFTVEELSNGKFIGTGDFYRGCHMDLGPMACLRYRGIRLVVTSRNQQAADQAMFRSVGVEPAQQRILILKSSVHFRADFAQLAARIIVVTTPGANVADLHGVQFQRLRAGVALLG
jgi:microcystin degradation protein MlrC